MSGSDRPSVALVGAGPGDPGLISLRGRELIASADVIVYDALANPEPRLHDYADDGNTNLRRIRSTGCSPNAPSRAKKWCA